MNVAMEVAVSNLERLCQHHSAVTHVTLIESCALRAASNILKTRRRFRELPYFLYVTIRGLCTLYYYEVVTE